MEIEYTKYCYTQFIIELLAGDGYSLHRVDEVGTHSKHSITAVRCYCDLSIALAIGRRAQGNRNDWPCPFLFMEM